MIKKIKSLYNKDEFDYSTGHVDPYEFHKTFYFIMKAFQVLDNEPIPRWTYPVLTILAVFTVIAITFCGIAMWNGVQLLSIPIMTEAGIYTIVLCYKLLILSCTQTNVSHYHNFLRILRDDFKYVCSKGNKYRDRFFENQLVTWKVCILAIIFTIGIAVGMILFATALLLLHLWLRKPGDGSKRPLLLPFWAWDLDFTATPIYEFAFCYSNIVIATYAYNYVFMIQTQIVWVRHLTAKVDLVIWGIEDLLDDIHLSTVKENQENNTKIIKLRLREIVSQHQSMYELMNSYAGVYKKLLMFEQKLCGPVVCLSAFCTAEKLDVGEFNAILVLLGVATVTLVFIPSYLCTYLRIKVSSVCDACMYTPFWLAGPVVRPYLVLLMQRSLRPLPLQAPGFEEISIATFSSKMASAYSLFNMLRQTNL